MAENKKSFVLYCDIIKTVEMLPNETAGELFKHLLSYVNDQDPKTENMLVKLAFEPIKQQLKRDLKKWESIREKRSLAGKKSAASRKQKQQVLTSVESVEQNPTNSTVNDTVNVNVNVNDITKRKEIKEKVAFDECAPSNSDDFRDFLDYWFEHGTNDKKMRFEKERSFSWSRRWKLWLRNKEKCKKEKSFAKIEKDRRPAYEIIQQVKNGTYGIDN